MGVGARTGSLSACCHLPAKKGFAGRDPIDRDFTFDSTVRIAPINVTGSRDTRDDLLDATRGSFLSQSFELAPLQIRDSLRYWRYFGQYFHYRALTSPAPVPLREGVKRPRVIYAGGVRAGVGRGIGGQDLIISERFFAGGGTSMRGFAQDTLGPVDFFGDPEGGEAVFITNQEVRFPMLSIFDGVGFVDIGNVFRRAGDFSLGDLRKSAGVGLRVRTPYFRCSHPAPMPSFHKLGFAHSARRGLGARRRPRQIR
ncbi:MAG: BamA/TamA family outer membrane protein [Bryobacteraceae bacterium]